MGVTNIGKIRYEEKKIVRVGGLKGRIKEKHINPLIDLFGLPDADRQQARSVTARQQGSP